MSSADPPFCLVTIYPPGRGDLGGSGWVDRRLLAALRAAGSDVEIVSVTGTPGEHEYGGFRLSTAGDVPLEIRDDPRALARVTAGMIISGEPYLVRKFAAFPGWRAAAGLLRARAAGRVVVTSGWAGLVLAHGAGCHVDLHLAHNVESTLAAAHSPLPLRLLGERGRMVRTEHRLLSAASRVLALSRTDAADLTAQGVPTGVLPLPLFPAPDAGGTGVPGDAVGFIGKAGWPPNAHALRMLLGPVHDELTRRGLDVPFVLAGAGTEDHLGHPRVVRAGRVASVGQFYSRVGLVAVPRFGASTGVSIKMIEAAEFGVGAVVPAALSDAVDPRGPWFVADDPASTADAIARWAAGDRPAVDPLEWVRRQRPDATLAALGGRPDQDAAPPSRSTASPGTNPESP